MKFFLLSLMIGAICGVIDVLPMLKMKLDKYSITSAFVHYLIVPFVIFSLPWNQDLWWLKGGIIGLVLAIPTIILVMKDDKKSAIPMVIMSIVLGSVIGVAGNFLNLM